MTAPAVFITLADAAKVQRLAAETHADACAVIERGGTGWQALAHQIQRDAALFASTARHAYGLAVAHRP